MRHLKLTFARVVLVAAPVSVWVAGNASAAAGEANKSDLGIGLFDTGTITQGKGDCGCAKIVYGYTTAVNGFHRGYGEELPVVIFTGTPTSATKETSGTPAAKTIGKTLKSVAVKDGGAFLRMKAGRLTECVFGAPNASGCGN
jgi:hypothetical protein